MKLYHDNDAQIIVELYDAETGDRIEDAVMLCSLKDSAGTAVTDFENISFTYDSSELAYIADVDYLIVNNGTAGTVYTLVAWTTNYDWKHSVQVLIIDPEPA